MAARISGHHLRPPAPCLWSLQPNHVQCNIRLLCTFKYTLSTQCTLFVVTSANPCAILVVYLSRQYTLCCFVLIEVYCTKVTILNIPCFWSLQPTHVIHMYHCVHLLYIYLAMYTLITEHIVPINAMQCTIVVHM